MHFVPLKELQEKEKGRAAFFQGGVHDVMTKRIFSQRTGNDAGSTIKKSLAVKDLTSELFSKISLNFDNFPKKMKILCCMKKGLPTRFFEVCDTHGSLPFSIILANVESNWKELYSLESELKCVCKWILLGFPCQFGWYHTACQYPAKISCAATPVNNQPKTKMDRMKTKNWSSHLNKCMTHASNEIQSGFFPKSILVYFEKCLKCPN